MLTTSLLAVLTTGVLALPLAWADPITGGIGGGGDEAVVGGDAGGGGDSGADSGAGSGGGSGGSGDAGGGSGGNAGSGGGSDGSGGNAGSGGGAGSGAGTDGVTTPPSGSGGGAEQWAHQPVWGADAETGARCIRLVRRFGVDPTSILAVRWELQTSIMLSELFATGHASNPFCSPTAGDESSADRSPAEVADAFIRRYPMPRPQAEIPPGFALTGLQTYLVLTGPDGNRWTHLIPGWGVLDVELLSRGLLVDWGDGVNVEVEPGRRGAPYGGEPSQQITHVYDDTDPAREVRVTALYAARWSLAAYDGVIEGLSATEAVALPVREFRAVRGDHTS